MKVKKYIYGQSIGLIELNEEVRPGQQIGKLQDLRTFLLSGAVHNVIMLKEQFLVSTHGEEDRKMSRLWTCPYCNRNCTIGDTDIRLMTAELYISPEYEWYHSSLQIIVCPNPECRQQTISLGVFEYNRSLQRIGKKTYFWDLKPESRAKPFPDYIPEQLRNDYEEACSIMSKSPKASATLSRRCLQGMIRHFWGIKKPRLIEEIEELKTKVDSTTWDAIDSVRQVGNIGAHMEKDVNLIIDVDPDEARLLIWLIETLFEEWYITRHEREARMKALVKVADDKKALKKPSP